MEKTKKPRRSNQKAVQNRAKFYILLLGLIAVFSLALIFVLDSLPPGMEGANSSAALNDLGRGVPDKAADEEPDRVLYHDELARGDNRADNEDVSDRVEKAPGKTESISPAGIPEKPAPGSAGNLVFVIDDVGNSLEDLDKFLKIPGPITFAVMPQRKYSAESVRRIKAAGKTAIIHQPMEPLGNANPGDGAIYVSMTKEQIWDTLDSNVADTGVTLGLNNHMGSRVTSDPETMEAVLSYMKAREMVFLDSFTTGDSVAHELADEMGLRYARRNSMFLDNESDRESIQKAIKAGEETARKKGHAVMIGHVMTDELAQLLYELYPTFIDDGFTLKDLSDLLHGEFDAGSWN